MAKISEPCQRSGNGNSLSSFLFLTIYTCYKYAALDSAHTESPCHHYVYLCVYSHSTNKTLHVKRNKRPTKHIDIEGDFYVSFNNALIDNVFQPEMLIS